jgi:hypothetical protein
VTIRWKSILAVVALVLGTVVGATVTAGAAGSGGGALKSTEVGVTATTIRIAVVADVDNTIRPGLFQSVRDAVQGFGKYINSKDGGGGLAGRKVQVDFIDSHLNPDETRNAFIQACQNDFAMIGTASIFASNVDDIVNCKDISGAPTGIPDIPFVATDLHEGCSPKTFPINPQSVICSTMNQHPQTYQASIGRAFYYKKKLGSSFHGVYVFSGDAQVAYDSQVTSGQGGMVQAGFKADVPPFKVAGSPQQSAFTPIVQAMKSHNSNYAQVGNPYDQTILLRREAQIQGFNAKLWDCATSCYDAKFLPQGGSVVNNEYVAIGYLPFLNPGAGPDLKANKVDAAFVKYVGKDKVAGFGVSGFAAGILLRDYVRDAVKTGGNNNVTRKGFFDYLNNKATAFSADGFIGTTNVSKRIVTPCYVLLQVKNGQYVRVNPTKAGSMNCDKRNLETFKLDLLQ